MANDVTLVTLPDSQIKQTGQFLEITAGVVIENIPTTGSNDQTVLMRARDAVRGSYPTFPGEPSLKLFSLVLKGFNTNSMTGVAVYQTQQFDVTSASYIRFTGFTQRQQTNLVPGTREPIKVSWKGVPQNITDSSGNVHQFTPEVKADLVTMSFMMPLLTVSVSGLVFGQPAYSYQDGIAYVNDRPWPVGIESIMPSKPKGYWMLQKYEQAISRYQGYYQYEALASTRVFADWSETGVLINRQTGRYCEVPPAILPVVNGQSYSYGIIFPSDPTIEDGIVRVGGNPLAEFQPIFGF